MPLTFTNQAKILDESGFKIWNTQNANQKKESNIKGWDESFISKILLVLKNCRTVIKSKNAKVKSIVMPGA